MTVLGLNLSQYATMNMASPAAPMPGAVRGVPVNRESDRSVVMEKGRRQAQIFVGEKEQVRAVRVSHPGQLTPDEIGRINDVLINSVIKDLTGCACLSGTIDVIWERNFDRVLDVQLG